MTNKQLLKKIEKAKARGAIYLNLSGKQLTILPPELFQMIKLNELDLGFNQLNTLPLEIGQLTKLTVLYLYKNQLNTLPLEICQLTKLTWLDLSRNQLTTLPPEICQLSNLKKLDLRGNPLISPPLEIAEQGIDAIREYFANLEAGEHPLNQVKILLLGDGASGKTSLTKRLIE